MADAEFVSNLAAGLQIHCVQGRSNVRRNAGRNGISLEMAARDARYAFFGRTMRKVGADVVATAHTANDQAETVLLKLVRGAGTTGLGGIRPRIRLGHIDIVRPLLSIRRKEIVAFLAEIGAEWREDKSNADLQFLRNRVRHEILPMLEARLNPEAMGALVRAGEILAAEDEWLGSITENILQECAVDGSVRGVAVRELPLAARRRVLREWLSRRGVPASCMTFDAMGRIDALLAGKRSGKRITLTMGWSVERQYDRLNVVRGEVCGHAPFRTAVKIPGETIVAEANIRVVTVLEKGIIKGEKGVGRFPATASLGRSRLRRSRLYVRSWEPGDRMSPMGMKGSKKIQDLFTDGKIPREQRMTVPLVVCRDEIVWVPGYRVARGWEVQSDTERSLHVRIERI